MKYRLRGNYSTDADKALLDVLRARGVKDLDKFLNPSIACENDPYKLKNIEAGARMLLSHLEANHSILLIQDCDVDGISSASIIWLYIKENFPEAKLEFRVHDHKQHGLSDMIDWIEEKDRWQLVIIPDAGSYDVEYHSRLNELGIDCLVLDHHDQEYDKEGNPITSNYSNTIVINNQVSPDYPNKSLCGAGVVYKFCEVLDEKLGVKCAQNYLDLVALGEIADVMDRTDPETNYLMLAGLKSIRNEGLQILLNSQSYSLKEHGVYPYEGLTAIDIAFYIAPLLNAITRVGTLQDKYAAFYCFTDPHKALPSTKRGAKAEDTEEAAEQAARVGANAKAKQNRIRDKAMELIDFKIQKYDLLKNNILLIEIEDEDDIPQEMTGLIAMGVVSKYNKPCLMGRKNSNGERIAGSLRNSSNFAGLPDLKYFLEESGYFNYVAGHANAAGFALSNNKIDKFLAYSNDKLSAEDFENCYLVDYVLDASNNNYDLLMSLASHPEYFGNHIDEVYLIIKNVPLGNYRLMGANNDTVKITDGDINYLKFKDLTFIEELQKNSGKRATFYGRVALNVWQGRVSLQYLVSDYEFTEDEHKYDF